MESIEDFLERKLHKQYKESLWHAMKIENALLAIKDDSLTPYTNHRVWRDGLKRKDNDPQYEDSLWVTGWSLTRDKNFALNWGPIILEFDKEEIKQNFKIMQISWNYSIPNINANHKKEREEFVLSGGIKMSINDFKKKGEELDELYDQLLDKKFDGNITKEEIKQLEMAESYNWQKEWQKPAGKNLPLKKNCIGIYLSKEKFDDGYYSNENIEEIKKHKLFKGFLSKDISENTILEIKKRKNKNKP